MSKYYVTTSCEKWLETKFLHWWYLYVPTPVFSVNLVNEPQIILGTSDSDLWCIVVAGECPTWLRSHDSSVLYQLLLVPSEYFLKSGHWSKCYYIDVEILCIIVTEVCSPVPAHEYVTDYMMQHYVEISWTAWCSSCKCTELICTLLILRILNNTLVLRYCLSYPVLWKTQLLWILPVISYWIVLHMGHCTVFHFPDYSLLWLPVILPGIQWY